MFKKIFNLVIINIMKFTNLDISEFFRLFSERWGIVIQSGSANALNIHYDCFSVNRCNCFNIFGISKLF